MSSRDPLPSAVPWLLRVSLASVGVQALALAGAHIGALPYAYGTAAACFVGMALAHAPLLGTRTLTTPRNVGLFLGVQVSLFTVALAATGGPSNPFSVLYLVYVSSAALALGGRWAAGFAVVTTVAYGSLFPLTEARGLHAIHHAGGFVGHLVGMWLAYALSAALVAYFLVRALAALAAKEADLELLRERASRQGKLLALGQLAAGAAHELGTPLATIAVVAKELGEPFVTTKGGPDEGALPGMGLGLFLVQSLADHLGGSFSLEERRPRGTTATLEIPGTTGV